MSTQSVYNPGLNVQLQTTTNFVWMCEQPSVDMIAASRMFDCVRRDVFIPNGSVVVSGEDGSHSTFDPSSLVFTWDQASLPGLLVGVKKYARYSFQEQVRVGSEEVVSEANPNAFTPPAVGLVKAALSHELLFPNTAEVLIEQRKIFNRFHGKKSSDLLYFMAANAVGGSAALTLGGVRGGLIYVVAMLIGWPLILRHVGGRRDNTYVSQVGRIASRLTT